MHVQAIIMTAIPSAAASPITFYWGSDAATFSNAQFSVGSPTGTVTGNFSRDSVIVKVGTYSSTNTTTNGWVSFPYASNIDKNEGSLCGWFYVAALNDYRVLFQLSDGAGAIYVIAMGSGQIRWIYTPGGTGFDQTTASGTPFSGAAWNWFELHWNKAANAYSLKVYDAADTLLISDTASSSTGSWGTTTSFEIGDVFNQQSFTYYDNYIISNSSATDMHAIRNNSSFP